MAEEEKKDVAFLTKEQAQKARDLEVARWDIAAQALGYADYKEVAEEGWDLHMDWVSGRVKRFKAQMVAKPQQKIIVPNALPVGKENRQRFRFKP